MNAIVSVTKDWAIGYKGKLLVPNREDMKRFAKLTSGGTVVMGRKTLESFPQGPLFKRRNICLTRSANYHPEGVEIASSVEELDELLSNEANPNSVWLIGGEMVYRLLLERCNLAFVTMNMCSCKADAYFPNLEQNPNWTCINDEEAGTTQDGVSFSYRTYKNNCLETS